MRQKSAFHKRANIRWMRFALTTGLVRMFPALKRKLHFPTQAISAIEAASQVIENQIVPVSFTPTAIQRDMVLAPATLNDTGDASGNVTGTTTLVSQAVILDGCVVAGHTQIILRESDMMAIGYKSIAPNWNYAKARCLKRRDAGPGLHAVLGGGRHYYHFFANDLFPLISYLNRLHQRGKPLKLVVAPNLPAYQREILAALTQKWPEISLVELARSEVLTGARLLWIFQIHSNYDWMPVDRPSADRLVAMLEQSGTKAVAPVPAARHLFVSRRDAKIRRMTDEGNVSAMLQGLGFVTFVPGQAAFAEQVAMFRGADVIVAVHGAALTNLLFCRPGTKIIEIFPENFIKSPYLWLSVCLGLDYSAVIGGPGDYDQRFAAGPDAVRAAVLSAMQPPEHVPA